MKTLVRSPKHLKFVRSLPCLRCGRAPKSEAAHIRAGTDGGTGLKPGDNWTVPLCSMHHKIQSSQYGKAMSEREFWGLKLDKAKEIANDLYQHSGDQEKAHVIMLGIFDVEHAV